HQAQAEQALANANLDAERIQTDAAAEAERIRAAGRADSEHQMAEAEMAIKARNSEADVYVEMKHEEGDAYLATKHTEADAYVTLKHKEADDYVAARQGEVYKNAEEAERERDKALAQIGEARAQVADLLQQAQAQSEFIRLEAEEKIREKVRAHIDQAERRIARLRITEQASRERIIAAQSELNSAISRLDSEPVQELGEGTPDQVIAEARQRVLNTGGDIEDMDEADGIADDSEIIDLDAEAQPVGSMSGSVAANASSDDQPLSDVDRVLSEPAIEPQNEDALSRLVREAMQRAVESARGNETN
ncbi:MAG: hypothetical protein WBM50_01660, partial [Acidimicrobiales bacterium]